MKHLLRPLAFVSLLVLCLFAGPTMAQDQTPVAPVILAAPITLPDSFWFGAYDAQGNLGDCTSGNGMVIKHTFVGWYLLGDGITTAINAALNAGCVPMITVEPYSDGGLNGLGDETLLQDIVTGWYDPKIRAVCEAIRAYGNQPVLVRFLHEVDLYDTVTGNKQFPWSTDRTDLAISVFRYFVTACRSVGATNALFIWSPAGSQNAALYYPGDDVVDYIALTALGYDQWDMQFSQTQTWRSFNELFWQRYSLIDDFGKPVLVAELGVCCGSAHQFEWLRDAYYAMQSREWYPLLRGAVYFNSVNPESPWAPGFTPDWRVCSTLFPFISFQTAVTAGSDVAQAGCPSEFAPLASAP